MRTEKCKLRCANQAGSPSRACASLKVLAVLAAMLAPEALCWGQVSIQLETVGAMSSRNQAAWWSPIAAHDGSVYVSYLAPNSPRDDVFVAKRDSANNWTTQDTGFNSRYDVGHTQTSLAIDGDGFIHLFYGMHGDPITYAQSDQPNSVTGGFTSSSPPAFGGNSGDYTYPNLATTPNGDVYAIIRDRRSGYSDQTGRLFHFENATNSWNELSPFAGQSGTTVYPDEIYADPSGDLHIIWEWAEGGPTGARHYGSYARYEPDTQNFFRADGSLYNSTPISIADADIFQGLEGSEVFDHNVHGFQSAKMTLDDLGRPIVAYSYSTTGTSSGYQQRIARWDGSQWVRSTIETGPFDIHKSWVSYTSGKLRHYGPLSPGAPQHSGTDDLFVRVSEDYGANWSTPVAITSGINIQRPVGVTVNDTDYLYLPDINTGQLHVGVVEFAEPQNALKVNIHPSTGEITLVIDSGSPQSFDFYQLVGSEPNAFDFNQWNSLDSQEHDSIGSGLGESWDEVAGADSSTLAEGFLIGSTTLAVGESLSLGYAYDPSVADQNLSFSYRDATTGAILTGLVEFFLLGDMDGNGILETVDVEPFVLALTNRADFLSTYPTVDPDSLGDFNGNGQLDLNDIQGFKAALLSAANANSQQNSVPEPNSLFAWLLLILVSPVRRQILRARRRS